MATIDDFKKIEMKVGTVLTAEYIEGADKLLKLSVDFGAKPLAADAPADAVIERDVRQILSGIRQWYQPEDLIGKQFPFVTNLEPRILRGLESNGMILAVKTPDGGAVLLRADREVPPGAHLS